MTVILTALAMITPYWQERGCDHGHREAVARTRLHVVMTAPVADRRKAWHYVVCVKYRNSHLRLRKQMKRLRQWRKDNDDQLRFLQQPAGWQGWAWSTSKCETGGTYSPTIHDPSGTYHGAFQFSLSTWNAAGEYGDPHSYSWYYQANVAIRFAQQYGTQHWPVCG